MKKTEKILKLYHTNGGAARSPFPSAENQIEILGFNYDAKRMGGAPMISGTVMYSSCLDDVWSDDVYVEFNGEKYYLKQTPTSSFSNADARYKHECEFVSERIKLDNVFFFDTVVGDPQGYDKPVSNSSVFYFFGNIREFAKRLNASLLYSKLQTKNEDGTYSGYVVIVNDDVDNEEKLLSFSNVPFSTALQESYNQFEIPYYFVGKEIHFGYWQNEIEKPFRYGVDKELLSITKTNSNQKVVTRCTGIGSAENLPYYYPNKHPQGELEPLYKFANSEDDKDGLITIVDDVLFAKRVLMTDVIERIHSEEKEIHTTSASTFYNKYEYDKWANEKGRSAAWKHDEYWFVTPNLRMPKQIKVDYATSSLGGYNAYDDSTEKLGFNKDNTQVAIRLALDYNKYKGKKIRFTLSSPDAYFHADKDEFDIRCWVNNQGKYTEDDSTTDTWVTFSASEIGTRSLVDGKYIIEVDYTLNDAHWDKSLYFVIKNLMPNETKIMHVDIGAELVEPIINVSWQRKRDNKLVELDYLGLKYDGVVGIGDKIIFRQKENGYTQPMTNLMPPVYWESNGEERFYNAENDIYNNPETGDKYTFANPYSDSKRVEHIVEFPDIKPTIEGMTNNAGQPINAFLEFAYDADDNDSVDQNGNYIHPYFYAKLPKFDSFNLFTHANEKGEVTFSMKNGNCGACNFVLGVNPESGKNDLQVDDNGKLLFEDGVAKRGIPQDRQNDTKNNEVWVALKKDNSTFGTIMPSAQHKYKPAVGDTFVLLNITMPIEYIKAAENKLKEEIIRYMYENNTEKFSFSIKFSRIYLAENSQILNTLNENAFIIVEYNGVKHPLYVSSFAYKMTAGETLPEITVELAETLSASTNAIQAAVSQVKTDVLDRVQKMDIAAMVAANFLSKNSEDYAKQKITFNRGIGIGTQDSEVAKIDQTGHADIESATLKQYLSSPNFRDGFSGEGFKMWLDENGLSFLTVDVLTARQRMVIYELLVSKVRSLNGELWVSAANGTIADVVDNGDEYEIYFEDDNTFIQGDYMRCQVFTGVGMKFYWVEVSRVEGAVVIVSKNEFGDVLPQVSDNVILCGSKNVNRQNAIHISATEDGQPRISIYNGISTKSLDGCLRTQLGNLDNITDDVLKPQGDGLYSDNAYLKGEFVLKNRGKSVDTMFAVTEEGIKASVEQTQAEAIKGKTLLYNASFTKGLDGWLTSNTDSTYFSGTSLLFASGSMLSQSVTVSSEPIYDNVFFVNIKNGWIKQSNMYFVNKPDFDGSKKYPLSFSTNIHCHQSGVLNVYVTNIEASKANMFIGYSNAEYAEADYIVVNLANNTSHALQLSEFGSISSGDKIAVEVGQEARLFNLTKGYEIPILEWREEQFGVGETELTEPCNLICVKQVAENEDFVSIDIDDLSWNGQGDFYLSFSGEADFYGLTMYTEKTEVRHKTFFEQSEKLIAFGAQALNADGSINKESGIVVQAEGSGLYARNEDGTQAKVAAYSNGVVTLEGEHIQLKGNLTVDGKFKVHEDGSIETKNALINGFVQLGTFYITDENFSDFYKESSISYSCDITNLSPIIVLEHTLALNGSKNVILNLPRMYSLSGFTKSDLEYYRGFIGSKVIIYNYTNINISYTYAKEDGTIANSVQGLGVGEFINCTCKQGSDSDSEFIYWEVIKGKATQPID